jgi:uncharacterized protein YqjF (DUF2071 family)
MVEASVEPVTPLTPRPVGRAVLRQDWLTLTFLHWAVDPARVAPLLPAGVRPDVLDGRTYVGLVPFLMHDVAGPLGPPVPYAGTFCETNVRVYSVDAAGRRGVVFLSLDAARLAPVLTARWAFAMPYLWSRMSLARDGDRLAYRCRRLWPGGPGVGATRSAVDVRVGGPVAPGPVEHFLTARWGLHLTDRRGRSRYWPNAHAEWPLRSAEVTRLDDGLLAAAGFADLAARPPDSVLYSPGVSAVFGPHVPAQTATPL